MLGPSRMRFNGRASVTHWVLIGASCILLTSCTGAIANRYAAELAVPASANLKTGLVILSVGAKEACHPSIGEATRLLVVHNSDSLIQHSEATLEVNPTFMDSEYADHYGHLYVLPLPAGEYYLVPSAGPYAENWTPPRADFQVIANETSYVGEFFLDNMCSDPAKFLLRDQETRDLALLRSKNSAFSHVRVAKRLLKFTRCDSFEAFC